MIYNKKKTLGSAPMAKPATAKKLSKSGFKITKKGSIKKK
jgi:hypothetical protein